MSNVPGFDFAAGYTAFQFVFVFLQMAAFGGIFTGFRLAEDYESGFARRLMLGAPNRLGIVIGYIVAGLVRYVADRRDPLGAGPRHRDDGQGRAARPARHHRARRAREPRVLAWTLGLAFRYQSVDIGSFMQTPVFVLLFLAPVYVPLALLTGWLHGAASVNPITLILDASRGFITGEPDKVLYAFAASLAIAGLGWLWAMRQMRRAERGVR